MGLELCISKDASARLRSLSPALRIRLQARLLGLADLASTVPPSGFEADSLRGGTFVAWMDGFCIRYAVSEERGTFEVLGIEARIDEAAGEVAVPGEPGRLAG